jgi:hypothetical protein
MAMCCNFEISADCEQAGKRDIFAQLIKTYQRTFAPMEVINYCFPWLERLAIYGSRWLPSSTAKAFLPTGNLRSCMQRQDGRQDFLTAIMGEHEKVDAAQLGWDDLYANASFFMYVSATFEEYSVWNSLTLPVSPDTLRMRYHTPRSCINFCAPQLI